MKNICKKQKQSDCIGGYKSSFLQPTEFMARNGKTVYISEEFHQNISRIVFMLGDGKITISDYLFHVLESHFKEYGELIKALYSENQKQFFDYGNRNCDMPADSYCFIVAGQNSYS